MYQICQLSFLCGAIKTLSPHENYLWQLQLHPTLHSLNRPNALLIISLTRLVNSGQGNRQKSRTASRIRLNLEGASRRRSFSIFFLCRRRQKGCVDGWRGSPLNPHCVLPGNTYICNSIMKQSGGERERERGGCKK